MSTHKTCMIIVGLFTAVITTAQPQFSEPTSMYLMHSSGNHLSMAADYGGVLESPTATAAQSLTFIPDGQGYYSIMADSNEPRFLALLNQWNTTFQTDSASANAKYAIESATSQYIRLRCKANNRYLGTDATTDGAKVYTDKNGQDMKHYWYLASDPTTLPPTDTISYLVVPQVIRQHFNGGWGVSLCWWAGQCGNWTDKKIDEIVDWLVSPTGLNYTIFRYNIGGGDDPDNNNCTPHHMGSGKGLRAEMEGFKDFSGDTYHWDRDEAQRKIMLKIREKRPDAIFEAFSNSCPWYMTYSGCVAGNTSGSRDNLRPEYYEEFAHYLVDVCRHYKDEYGIEFRTLEPFNESASSYWSAGGGQEGCHFDYASQVAFIRVLKPILEASGLSTVISASDETSVSQSVEAFRQYQSAGILPMVGQWNTHTYSASISDRTRLSQLAHTSNIPLWMSEVGAGGSGIGGNLSLVQKLINDMRYIQPEAWVDWQYMEEGNDQWCMIRGSFSRQTYSKVKNYYVRQQCTRFIQRGYNIITSLNNQTLAAMNQAADTLVLVVLNEGSQTIHRADLSLFDQMPTASRIKAYRTSETENLQAVRTFKLDGTQLIIELPAQSITTLVIPVQTDMSVDLSTDLPDDVPFLIIPRNETTRTLTATAAGGVTIEDITNSQAQQWQPEQQADGSYVLVNGLGLRLTSHRQQGSSQLTATAQTGSEQTFVIENIDYPYCKIVSKAYSEYALDLASESTSAGTKVDTWQYTVGTTTPSHRQWMFVPLSAPHADDIADGIDRMMANNVGAEMGMMGMGHDGIYDVMGHLLSRNALDTHGLTPGRGCPRTYP